MNCVVIVGAGLAGSVLARKLAEECDQKVIVIEKRNHIAGNVYDEYDQEILVQRYGPHFLLTYEWSVIEYLKRFSDFYEYPARAMSYLNGKYIARPYNFRTLQQLLGPENSQMLLKKLRTAFQNRHRITLFELLQSSDEDIAGYGKLLYSQIYAPYVAKQWGCTVEELDPEVINRSEIVLGYDTQLADWDFQYLPSNGYTAMVDKMLSHTNIEVRLNSDALQDISFDKNKVLFNGEKVKGIVYTGQIDELFGERFGRLPYRSRYFSYECYPNDKVLPCGVVTYPKEEEYLRKTEFRQFNPVNGNPQKTIVQLEYSLTYSKESDKGNEPYYPILNDANIKLYNRYKNMADTYDNLFLCGRLAEYRYYDMDKVVLRAFEVFESMRTKGIL